MKKGFTLAEIMIVLTIIGVLTAILLPAAFNARPNESIMKFKKANNTLGTVIKELVSNDKYYSNGDLGQLGNGANGAVDGDHLDYLCETMVDLLSTKETHCEDHTGTVATAGAYSIATGEGDAKVNNIENLKDVADKACKAGTPKADFITSDGIIWYEAHYQTPFGLSDSDNKRIFAGQGKVEKEDYKDANGFDGMYKILCFDVDAINEGTDPFGYAVRADGRIIPGKNASDLINESIMSKD